MHDTNKTTDVDGAEKPSARLLHNRSEWLAVARQPQDNVKKTRNRTIANT